MEKSNTKTYKMTRLAILVAILLIMAYTPLGYFRTAGLEVSFLMIPVVIGAIVMGPVEGAFLGLVFGATSFGTCFGTSAFGAALLAISPVATFITCIMPRVLAGFLAGVIFRALSKSMRLKMPAFAIASLSGALLNTLFFMSSLMLCFGHSEYIVNMMAGKSVIPFVVAFVGVQGLVEAAVCALVGTAVSRALSHFLSATKKTAK